MAFDGMFIISIKYHVGGMWSFKWAHRGVSKLLQSWISWPRCVIDRLISIHQHCIYRDKPRNSILKKFADTLWAHLKDHIPSTSYLAGMINIQSNIMNVRAGLRVVISISMCWTAIQYYQLDALMKSDVNKCACNDSISVWCQQNESSAAAYRITVSITMKRLTWKSSATCWSCQHKRITFKFSLTTWTLLFYWCSSFWFTSLLHKFPWKIWWKGNWY